MYIDSINSNFEGELRDTYRSYEQQIHRMLGLLDGTERFSYLLRYVPDDAGWPDSDASDDSEYNVEYLQAGGAAEAMTVEVRRKEADGDYHQYVLGRPGDDPAQPDIWIPIADHGQSRRPSEIFTADTATPIFYHYFQTRTVPDGLTLRELDLRWPTED